MTAKSHSSIVATKYGSRPLIDVPPISVGDIRHSSAPAQLPKYLHGNIADHMPTYKQPAGNHQTSILPPAVPNPQKPFWSNVLQNSNVVPFNYVHPPYQSGMPPYPGYSSSYPPQNGYPQQQAVPDMHGDLHYYYGPSGEVLPGPLPNFGTYGQNMFNRTIPMDFKLEGKLEHGRLVSIQVKESNISYRDLPKFLIKDLKRMYGHVPKTYVTIIAEDGEYSIYATPDVKQTELRNQGYIYNDLADNHLYDRKGNVYSVDVNKRQPRDLYVVSNEPRLPVQKPERR